MLSFIYDFIPVLLFFLAFKIYGIYTATVVGIVTTALQVLFTTFFKRRVDKQQVITLLVFVVFGGMTLYFHNPIFVKWKPSIIFWIFSAAFLISHFVGQKPLIQRMMEKMLEDHQPLPSSVWSRINLAWALFFAFLGTLNIYIAYHYSTDTWVNFKFYGIMSMLFLFSISQAVYLSRYMTDES